MSCRSCVSCMCAGHWPEEYFGLVCPLARTRARGDKPRAGTGHVPPAGVGSRPPPPEPGRVTSPQSPAWTSQRGCPPQLTARAEGGTECGAGPLHACGRPQPVRLRPVGPSRSPCHHQPIPKAWKGRNVKCEIKRPARAPGRAEGPAARGAPLSLSWRRPHWGRLAYTSGQQWAVALAGPTGRGRGCGLSTRAAGQAPAWATCVSPPPHTQPPSPPPAAGTGGGAAGEALVGMFTGGPGLPAGGLGGPLPAASEARGRPTRLLCAVRPPRPPHGA